MDIPWPALLGGILIGTASALALGMNGKIPGISGVCARIFRRVPGDTLWRVAFLVGLVAGAGLAFVTIPGAREYSPRAAGLGWTAAAGLLVGVGTRLGGGCTSGHGVCGMGRGSARSTIATLTFMAVAIATVWAVRQWGGMNG